jgi:DNA-binding IclR family transcriptional regulator
MGMDYRPVKSAERAVRILEVLAASPELLTLPDLQERLGYPRSSVYALVRTQRELGWIECDATGSRFGIGPDALSSGSAYLDRDPALPYVAKALDEFVQEVKHSAHYARRDGSSVLYLASREFDDGVYCAYQVGRRRPTHMTALGKALLAELTRAEIDDLLPKKLQAATENTVTDRDALHEQLDLTRQRGWSMEREEGTLGIACVAAAVNYRVPATDAMSCTLPVEVADRPDELAEVTRALVDHARRLERTLRADGIR